MSYVPSWYDSSDCGVLRFPRLDLAASSGAEYGLKSNISKCQKWQDDPNGTSVLVVIDAQLDFISPDGSLCVPGAVADTDRLNRFIYANVGELSHIAASLDSHYLFQPFHRLNWAAGSCPTSRQDGTMYQEGDHPDPFTIITLADVRSDVWRPLRHPVKMVEYLNKLEQSHQKNLCIWPFHCILGTPGHAWDPSFVEAMVFHAAARGNQYMATLKGMSQLSEHYGILKAEVEFAEDRLTQLNTRVISLWEEANRIYFAGQAKSHCCLETLRQVVNILSGENRGDLLRKLFVLKDCMSSVADIVLPDGTRIEFDRMANDEFKKFENDFGVQFVDSTSTI